MTHFTNLISIFKILLPTLTIIVLIASGFHAENFGHNIHEFMPYGSRSIFEATSISGIIMSYDAFQTVINMGGEIKNPRKKYCSWGFNFNDYYGCDLCIIASNFYWSS